MRKLKNQLRMLRKHRFFRLKHKTVKIESQRVMHNGSVKCNITRDGKGFMHLENHRQKHRNDQLKHGRRKYGE